jgi:amino acid efflux transporter
LSRAGSVPAISDAAPGVAEPHLGAWRGAALYVGALVGPGVLLVPSLAADAAGPAAILAWAAMLVLSLPLAATFAVLGVRHPVAGGVTAYVAEAFGRRASAITGTCFLTAVILGAPAVSLIGGYYVADLTGGGRPTAVGVAAAMYILVLGANALGLHVSTTIQLALSAVLVLIILLATATALPAHDSSHWTPFAPHGWLAVGTAANILAWLFFGWEAMAQFAGDFREPRRDIPRAVMLAYGTIAVLYLGLGVATVDVASGTSTVPLADLLQVGFGEVGRRVTALLAVALTVGTMNVYVGGAAKLAGALAGDGVLPGWLDSPRRRGIPRRPLIVLACTGGLLLTLLAANVIFADGLVRSTSASFVAVYIFALASATRVLVGRSRWMAATALGLISVVMVFSGAFLLVPAAGALLTWLWLRHGRTLAPRLPVPAGEDA